MREILVTNDDGVHSEGIKELAAALAHLGKVTIVAPMQEASAIGHALTLRRPLRIETISANTFGIDGTPTDCVNLAILARYQAEARSHRLGDQQGLEPR
jgi:5'-nucleotidase